jgi:hypothetical protein
VLERGEDLVSDRGDAVGLGGRRPGFGSDGPRTASPGHRARADQAAIETVVQRLLSQFPEVPLETIQRAVAGEYDEYDNSALRDFVPILVERAVRAELRHRA